MPFVLVVSLRRDINRSRADKSAVVNSGGRLCAHTMPLCVFTITFTILKLALFICFRSISEGFQWSFHQQANHVFDVAEGSDISLPCEYVLSPQEQQEASIFYLLTWTREEPMNSDRWAGLAIQSTLVGSKVIYDDPQRIFITNGTLTVKNVAVKDHTRYQCAFQSSFFTTPSIVQLNVQCEYAT